MRHLRCCKLASELYQSTANLKLPAHLKSQWLRACSSVALNLAEGTGKSSLEIALGSVRECQAIAQLEPRRFSDRMIDQLDHLGASVYRLILKSQRN